LTRAAIAAVFAALLLAGCGGGAKVGSCIDAQNKVVDCGSSESKAKLVSDQEKSDAIACIVIDDPPQRKVTVDGHKFCADPGKR
jgi:hypothetical protein